MGEGSPTKIDYRQKGTLILTSLLEHLVTVALFDARIFSRLVVAAADTCLYEVIAWSARPLVDFSYARREGGTS